MKTTILGMMNYIKKVDEELGKLSIDTLKERLRIYKGIQKYGTDLYSPVAVESLIELADIAVENVSNHLKKRKELSL